MAKNRSSKKKQKNGAAPMDLASSELDVTDEIQAMDTSESASTGKSLSCNRSKVKKIQMKRSKNVRKMKAIAKAVSKNEMEAEKVLKNQSKVSRIQSAKKLYD